MSDNPDAPSSSTPPAALPPPPPPDASSTVPQISSPPDPASIPIHPPHGTPPPPAGALLPEVEMAEAHAPNGVYAPNGILNGAADSPMDASPGAQPNGVNGHGRVEHSASEPNLTKLEQEQEPLPASASMPAEPPPCPTSAVRSAPDHMEDDQPPAKRARKLSNADQASLNHTNGSSSTHPMSNAQYRFATSTVRSLKKIKDAAPFVNPVDPVALNIPHYTSVIKHPMDFSTVERKLFSSNPQKPDPDPTHARYHSAEEFVADVRLIFDNCYRFNGPEHVVSEMGKRVEAVFDKQIKQMPPNEEPKAAPAPKKHVSPVPPPPPAPAPALKKSARRPSTATNAMPVIRRSDSEMNSRPKREIHPPAPKDLPYADAPKKTRGKKQGKDDGTADQLKFCGKLINDMFKKQNYAMASPFYEPVDWLKLDIPSYPKIVKKPMDLSTMKKKLDNHEYSDATKFFADFKLMIRNCFLFNPTGTPVNQAGVDLQTYFDQRWHELPPFKDVSDDFEEDDEDSDEDQVALLTSQLEQVKNNLAQLQHKKKKKKDKGGKISGGSNYGASSSKAASKPSKKSKGKGKADLVDEVLTFDQKKDLSETIQTLEGPKLERVIQIIHEGVPEIRDSTEEIELDIDSLPPSVLLKLYNYVLRPARPKAVRPGAAGGRHPSGTGTGGLKRKSMDEEAEAERIRLLEERIRLFDQEQGAGAGSGQSSDSSDSDSSSGDSD